MYIAEGQNLGDYAAKIHHKGLRSALPLWKLLYCSAIELSFKFTLTWKEKEFNYGILLQRSINLFSSIRCNRIISGEGSAVVCNGYWLSGSAEQHSGSMGDHKDLLQEWPTFLVIFAGDGTSAGASPHGRSGWHWQMKAQCLYSSLQAFCKVSLNLPVAYISLV